MKPEQLNTAQCRIRKSTTINVSDSARARRGALLSSSLNISDQAHPGRVHDCGRVREKENRSASGRKVTVTGFYCPLRPRPRLILLNGGVGRGRRKAEAERDCGNAVNGSCSGFDDCVAMFNALHTGQSNASCAPASLTPLWAYQLSLCDLAELKVACKVE